MKPILGVDITEDKENEILNGNEFIIQRTPESSMQAFEKALDNNFELINKAKLPLAVRIVKGIFGFAGLVLTLGTVRAWDTEESIIEYYQAIPWIFWVCGACIAIWGILEFSARKKAKKIIQSDEGDYTKNTLETVVKNIYAEHGVPASAPETDILAISYKIKDGEVHPKARTFESTPFTNLIYKVFSDSENLYLVNCEAKYAFPLTGLKAIRTVKKRIMLSDWNKDEKPNKGIYKSYKLSVDDHNNVYAKPYHFLEIEHNGETYGIYFPCYELPVFEEVTGLKAETE